MSTSEHPIATKSCDIISTIYAVIMFILFIILVIITIKQRTFTVKQVFSFNLGIVCVINAISFLMPDPELSANENLIDKSNNPMCLVKALFHVGTIIGSVNITFLCYFLFLVEISNKMFWERCCFQTICYIVNWIIIGLFIVFFAFYDLELNKLECCRFQLGQAAPTTSIVYSAVLIVLTFIEYFLLRYKVKQIISKPQFDEIARTRFKNALNYFIIVVLLTLFKLISFCLKQFNFIGLEVADRIIEHLYGIAFFVLFGIGTENIYLLICPKKNKKVTAEDTLSLTYTDSEIVCVHN